MSDAVVLSLIEGYMSRLENMLHAKGVTEKAFPLGDNLMQWNVPPLRSDLRLWDIPVQSLIDEVYGIDIDDFMPIWDEVVCALDSDPKELLALVQGLLPESRWIDPRTSHSLLVQLMARLKGARFSRVLNDSVDVSGHGFRATLTRDRLDDGRVFKLPKRYLSTGRWAYTSPPGVYVRTNSKFNALYRFLTGKLPEDEVAIHQVMSCVARLGKQSLFTKQFEVVAGVDIDDRVISHSNPWIERALMEIESSKVNPLVRLHELLVPRVLKNPVFMKMFGNPYQAVARHYSDDKREKYTKAIQQVIRELSVQEIPDDVVLKVKTQAKQEKEEVQDDEPEMTPEQAALLFF